MSRFRLGPDATFLSRYIPEPNSGCWLWEANCFSNGYGRFITEGAHRYSWRLHNGPIPEDMHVLHHCDVKPCINPAHLFLGDPHINAQDMRSKKRHLYGVRSPRAGLTEEDARAIKASTERTSVLAARYGVSSPTIYAIRTGTRWSHLEVAQEG